MKNGASTGKGIEVSFRSEENFLKLFMLMVSQLCG